MDHVCGGACGGGWAQGGRKNCLVVKLDSNLTLCFFHILHEFIDTKNLAKKSKVNPDDLSAGHEIIMNDPLSVGKRTIGYVFQHRYF